MSSTKASKRGFRCRRRSANYAAFGAQSDLRPPSSSFPFRLPFSSLSSSAHIPQQPHIHAHRSGHTARQTDGYPLVPTLCVFTLSAPHVALRGRQLRPKSSAPYACNKQPPYPTPTRPTSFQGVRSTISQHIPPPPLVLCSTPRRPNLPSASASWRGKAVGDKTG